jgi:hypothetical protein
MSRKIKVTFISLFFTAVLYAQVPTIHNSLDSILACEDKIELELVKVWGDAPVKAWGGGKDARDKPEFYQPADVLVDKENNVYILDREKHSIHVFDSLGNPLRILGKKGKGPGQFDEPMSMDFNSKGNIIVSDLGNKRIQTITTEGDFVSEFKIQFKNIKKGKNEREERLFKKYISKYPGRLRIDSKDHIVMRIPCTIFNPPVPLFSMFDREGNIIRMIGKHLVPVIDMQYNSCEPFAFTIDKQDNLFISYCYRPFILKYSITGEILATYLYELPFEVKVTELGSESRHSGQRMIQIASGGRLLDLDDEGRLFVITMAREITEKEYFTSGTRSSTLGGLEVIAHGIDSDTTDLQRLMVLNPEGKVIASKRLNHLCDILRIFNNRLFIIDCHNWNRIYEYRVRFKF